VQSHTGHCILEESPNAPMEGERPAHESDERVRAAILAGNVDDAVTEVLHSLGPEVFGFLRGALGNEPDADEVFALTGERIWRSLAGFRWQSTLRTWVYVIARHEMLRFLRGARRHRVGRVTPSALEDVVAAVRTETLSALRTEKRSKLEALRDELPVDDRTLLILRVDRSLKWEDIARAFLPDPDRQTEEQLRREAARLRKRFQLVRQRLTDRAREEGLLPK
jgi:RNA polymerase sigma-70 factor (ECF subfamily)